MNSAEYNSLLKTSLLGSSSRSKYFTEAQQAVFVELASKYNITVDQVTAFWSSIGAVNLEFMKDEKMPVLTLDRIVKIIPRPKHANKNKEGDDLADCQEPNQFE